MKNVYVVFYRKTSRDDFDTKSGVYDSCYTNEDDAIKKCWDLTDEKMNDAIGTIDEDDMYRESNAKGNYQCVTIGSNIYEYAVRTLDVIGK